MADSKIAMLYTKDTTSHLLGTLSKPSTQITIDKSGYKFIFIEATAQTNDNNTWKTQEIFPVWYDVGAFSTLNVTDEGNMFYIRYTFVSGTFLIRGFTSTLKNYEIRFYGIN